MFGIIEIITLLLGLSGFGLQPNPKPVTSDVALQYAIPDADVVVHVDVASIVPGNYKQLLALPNQPQIKASPELSRLARELVTEVEGARNVAKATTGIDLTTDITDATAFVSFVGRGKDPAFVAVVRGKLDKGMIDKIAGMTGKQAATVGSGKMLEMGGKEPALAITKDGVLLAGTPALIRQRLDDRWRAPARTGRANLAYAAAAIDSKPVFSIAVTLSAGARREVQAQLSGTNFITDLVKRHKGWAFSAYHDGIGWTWADSTRAGLDQMAQMSEGFADVLRAAQIAPRGFAKILLAALDSYRGTNRRIDEVIRRKGDIWKIVEAYTGDGNFKVAINKDPARLRLEARLTGKHLSEVLPAGLIGPAALIPLFATRKAAVSAPPSPAIAVPPPPPQRPQPKRR